MREGGREEKSLSALPLHPHCQTTFWGSGLVYCPIAGVPFTWTALPRCPWRCAGHWSPGCSPLLSVIYRCHRDGAKWKCSHVILLLKPNHFIVLWLRCSLRSKVCKTLCPGFLITSCHRAPPGPVPWPRTEWRSRLLLLRGLHTQPGGPQTTRCCLPARHSGAGTMSCLSRGPNPRCQAQTRCS